MPFMEKHAASFLRTLKDNAEIVSQQFEQIEVIDVNLGFEECLSRAEAILAA